MIGRKIKIQRRGLGTIRVFISRVGVGVPRGLNLRPYRRSVDWNPTEKRSREKIHG